MGWNLVRGSVLVATSWIVWASPTEACEPAANYSVTIVEDDSPDCVTIESFASYQEGSVRVDNQCADEFAFAVQDCPGCGDPITVPAGEAATMVVETRNQASTATLTWSVGDVSGQLRADTHWQDNSDACDGFRSCRVGSHAAPPVWAVGLVLLALSYRKARARGTRCCRRSAGPRSRSDCPRP